VRFIFSLFVAAAVCEVGKQTDWFSRGRFFLFNKLRKGQKEESHSDSVLVEQVAISPALAFSTGTAQTGGR
jgi:hypothetical protein